MISVTRNLASGNGMFYALYSEGFLTGGFNTEVNANLPVGGPDLSYGPEHVDNFEIGFKGQLIVGAENLRLEPPIGLLYDYVREAGWIAQVDPPAGDSDAG